MDKRYAISLNADTSSSPHRQVVIKYICICEHSLSTDNIYIADKIPKAIEISAVAFAEGDCQFEHFREREIPILISSLVTVS